MQKTDENCSLQKGEKEETNGDSRIVGVHISKEGGEAIESSVGHYSPKLLDLQDL